MALQLVHEPDASRYVALDGEQLVSVLDYRINGDAISFTRTFTIPPRRGQGLAEKVVRFAVDDVERSSTRHILPLCWYAEEWFQANPERTALLTPRG